MSRLLEICAASLASARAAQAGGAQRIELCQHLEQGGTTPSYGLLRQVLRELRIPVFVLIRPRPGHFAYDAGEQAIMQADVELCRDLGAAGVVLGALTPEGRVDVAACRSLIAAAGPLPVTFHRAFDDCPDPHQALEDVIGLGCARVLTSGGAATAEAGQARLAALVRQAGSRISIMPGAGITAANIRAVAAATGARELHASAKRRLTAPPLTSAFAVEQWETDVVLVTELARLLAY